MKRIIYMGTIAGLLAGSIAVAQDDAYDTGMTMGGTCSMHDAPADGADSLTRSLHSMMPMEHAMPSETYPGTRGAPAPAPDCSASANKLPDSVTKMLASKEMRQHHYLWHLVRGNWDHLPAATKTKLTKQGWKPPRQEGEKGSGADFICMHHEMVKDVSKAMKDSGDACYKDGVTGWNPIPWDPKDKLFPMPSDNGTGDDMKSPATTAKYKKLVDTKYSKDAWLKKQKSIDDVGMEFEDGIHGWFHMHWATENGPADPMKCGDTAAGGCDWLGTPYTAHVNPTFWKLHGWIEERAQRWAELHNTTLDAACKDAKAFAGPEHHMPMGGHDMAGMPHGRGMPGMDNDDDFNDVVKDLPPALHSPKFHGKGRGHR